MDASWIEQNKEWVFSGAGVAVIMSIISAGITYWLRERSERKKKKRLSFNRSIKGYQIPGATSDEQLKITYKTKPYENLCEYLIEVKNAGLIAIEGQQILVQIPKSTNVVEVLKSFRIRQITAEEEVTETEGANEHLFNLSRMEPGDWAKLSIILDSKNPNEVTSEPRGVDSIDYTFNGAKDISDISSDITQLSFYIAASIMIGTLSSISPAFAFIEDVFRAVMILLSTSPILRIIKNWNFDKKVANRATSHQLKVPDALVEKRKSKLDALSKMHRDSF